MSFARAALLISLWSTACSGGGDKGLPAPYARLAVPGERLSSPAAISRGRELYAVNCALCHGERGDGHGRRASGFARPPRSFVDPAWRASSSPRRVYFAIREGLHGTPMPSWKALSEDECWDLAAYVLSLGSPGPGGRPSG